SGIFGVKEFMKQLPFLLLLTLLLACAQPQSQQSESFVVEQGDSLEIRDETADEGPQANPATSRLAPSRLPEPEPLPISELEQTVIDQGLIKARDKISDAIQDLKYSSSDNFLNQDVYGDFNECYLQAEAVDMLADAQARIDVVHPRLKLILYDCVRPRSVQYKMWEIVKGTDQQKYVASPKSGSMHNYGAAVDLGLYHLDTGLVDMGTPFDFFGNQAQPRYEAQFVASGELTQAQVDNRLILRKAMREAGFHMINSEWWHFNAFDRKTVRAKYQIVE
ncbi:MAG: M15 family metallopeptidase, partial [Bacteroidota bacterium]